MLKRFIEMQFERTTADLTRGHFRVHGETIEVMPANEEVVIRLETSLGEIRSITKLDPVTRKRRAVTTNIPDVWIFPAKHFITEPGERERSLRDIEAELKERLAYFQAHGKLLEADRLDRRTRYDLAMMREVGYCHGIENYSRILANRPPGAPPDTLLSYFPEDFLMVIDESHVTIPQIGGMSSGDRARKETLIEHGFRLPSAADNRPLVFTEFEARMPQTIFVSATPGAYEAKVSSQTVEQIIRPTGLVDPETIIRPVNEDPVKGIKGQVDDLIERIKERVVKKERVLVTTLTKKMAEDLTQYLESLKIKVQYVHSDVETLDRIKILHELRRGVFDVLVGVNLLREGLDLPEVSLVAILDADKEGFLRSETSLIQTIGRAARNVGGQVILYADHMTGSLDRAIRETDRRRKIQLAYNVEHGITPTTIIKSLSSMFTEIEKSRERAAKKNIKLESALEKRPIEKVIAEKEKQMKEAAKALEFELAALLRDELRELKKGMGAKLTVTPIPKKR
jgi:excinuclease ABC subunit B